MMNWCMIRRTDIRNQEKGGRNGQERRYVSGVGNEQRFEATTAAILDNSRKQLLTSSDSFQPS